MPHALITGTSTCGKTTLAKALAARWRRRGVGVIVLDPLFSTWPAANVQFSSPAGFLHYCQRARSCAVFADEAGGALGRDNRAFDWLATQARHRGHEVHFLTQRPTQLHPTIRENCEALYAFKLSRAAATMLAEEFTCPAVAEIVPNLGKYEFLHCTRFTPARVYRLNLVDGQAVANLEEISR